MSALRPSRRTFIKGLAAGGLLVTLRPAAASAAKEPARLAGWLRIAPDGTVTILTNTSEIGQGTGTAIAQLVGDELDVPWKAIRLEMAPVEKDWFNPGWQEYATYGSGGVAQQAEMLRTAGARARAMLVGAAAERWKVPAADCTAGAGVVSHSASGRHASYGALAQAASRISPPEKPPLKQRESWNYIGKPMQRLDLPAKVDGSAVYGIDVKLPGLLVATIAQCPVFGGRLASVDHAPAMAVRGVRRVVELHDAVAVVATGYWPARQGLQALKPSWDLAAGSKTTSRDYDDHLAAAARGEGVAFAPKGTTAAALVAEHDAAMATAARRLESVYQVPFAAHATMEPMNATARPTRSGMELWLPTQSQSASRDIVAQRLGLPKEKVVVHTTLAGGGFGRRIELDFAVQAAEIAHAAAAPVKLIWSREEDLQHDWYRPAAAIRIAAGLDAQGMPIAWRFETACASLLDWSRYGAFKGKSGEVDTTSLMGLVRPGYKLRAPRFGWTRADAGVPVAFWRSVGASQNVFALESFLDEIAEAAGKDPLQIRLDLLEDSPREKRVLQAAADAAGWSRPAAPGRHRGLSLARANGSAVAQVAELSVESGSRVRLHRITCAIDCGLAVNPDAVKAQMEGGIAFGLTTAFLSEITLAGGRVEQQNFDGFPLISLAQMPEIEVQILDSAAPPGGAGEESVAPVAPAIANALRSPTGRRIRRLPFSRDGITLV